MLRLNLIAAQSNLCHLMAHHMTPYHLHGLKIPGRKSLLDTCNKMLNDKYASLEMREYFFSLQHSIKYN